MGNCTKDRRMFGKLTQNKKKDDRHGRDSHKSVKHLKNFMLKVDIEYFSCFAIGHNK